MPTPTPKFRINDYPFGRSLNTRGFSAGSGFRFGFNGKEQQGDIGGYDYDFGARIYEGRLGKWFSRDQLSNKYPYLSVYNFSSNNPICFNDLDGKDFIFSISGNTITIKMTVNAISQTTYQQAKAGAAIWNSQKDLVSKGYNVKFEIQVICPPAISQSEVINANLNNSEPQKLFKKNGNPTTAFYEISENLSNEQMLRDAKSAYYSNKIGSNNIFAGKNKFANMNSSEVVPKEGEVYERAISNGVIITTNSIKTIEFNVAQIGAGFENAPVYVDQGIYPYVVGHEMGHNMGLLDLESGGIMDYRTAENGKIAQIELDILVDAIIQYKKSTENLTKEEKPIKNLGRANFKSE